MNQRVTQGAYGELIEPTTLRLQRRLPGPIERVWAYVTESDLRRKWLAAGEMQMKVGAECELVWRNDELTNPPGQRPDGYAVEHRMPTKILELDPPRHIVFTFGNNGDVTIDLEPKGNEVLLTLVHRRLPDRTTMLRVSAGWHSHLDILVARVSGKEPAAPFWDGMADLLEVYDRKLPA
jgi:uncharacterized protein YndB with AHSA1/START domain